LLSRLLTFRWKYRPRNSAVEDEAEEGIDTEEADSDDDPDFVAELQGSGRPPEVPAPSPRSTGGGKSAPKGSFPPDSSCQYVLIILWILLSKPYIVTIRMSLVIISSLPCCASYLARRPPCCLHVHNKPSILPTNVFPRRMPVCV
jgi:hypothetical protein